jgi:O-antigen ligase
VTLINRLSYRAAAQRLSAWLLAPLAALAGYLLAFQPLPVAVAGLGAVGIALLALLTPLAALTVMLVVAPLRTLIATEAVFPLPLDIGQLALVFALGIWALQRLALRLSFIEFRLNLLHTAIIGFIIATGISGFNAVSFGAWVNEWLKWVQVLVLVIVVQQLGAAGRWRWLVFALTVAGLANALIGIYEFFGGSGALHLLVNGRFFRAFGTFGQPNPFGGFMGLLAPLALASALGYGVSLWRTYRSSNHISRHLLAAMVFFSTVGGIMALALVMSWSRGAWLAFAAAIGAILFALPRKLWHSLALVAIVAAIVGLVWTSGRLPVSITARLASATEELFSFSDVRGVDITPENYAVVERLAHWQAALNMARAEPWTGVGFGNYEAAYPQFRLINWKFALGHAHNYYLNVLAEAGIIGLLAYSHLWFVVLFVTWRARRHPNPIARLTAAGLLGTWVYLTVHSLTDNLYVNNLFLHIGVMLGILAVIYAESENGLRLRVR